MTHKAPPEHFKGKVVSEHLKDARKRGASARAETHGVEATGFLSGATDNAKTTAALYLVLWAIFNALGWNPLPFFITFGTGLVIWNTGRSCLLGWARLERVHKVIEEERYEIEHHRDQEKQELKEMYEAKGFSGKLLDEVVDVLMADDNRLLRVMLEEELGLSLEIYEHPLKQGLFVGLVTLIAAAACILSYFFWQAFGIPLVSLFIIALATKIAAKYEKRRAHFAIVWNLSLTLFTIATVYFLTKLLI